MQISFDPAKSAANAANRDLPFTLAQHIDWSTALFDEDTRKNYGERRFQVLGFIGDRLHVTVLTPRAGKMHIISLRKANRREVRRYEKETTQP